MATLGRPFLFMSPVLDHGYIDLYVETYRCTVLSTREEESGGSGLRATVIAQEDVAWVTSGVELINRIAEPLSRTGRLQHFRVTPFSLGAVVDAPLDCFPSSSSSSGGEEGYSQLPRTPATSHHYRLADQICNFLCECTHNWEALCADPSVETGLRGYICSCVERYKVVSVVMDTEGGCLLESTSLPVLKELLTDRGLLSQIRGRGDEDGSTISIRKHVVVQKAASTAPTSSSSNLAPILPAAPAATSTTWRVDLEDTASAPVVRERCLKLGYPAFQDYVFANDSQSDSKDGVRSIDLHLRPQCAPRPYQYAAVASVVGSSSLSSTSTSSSGASGVGSGPNSSLGEQRCRSGIIVLPCGAGKTLVGVMCAAAVRKRTLIVCAGSVSVAQWKNQLLEFASLGASPNPTGGGASSLSAGVPRYGANPNVQRIACVTGKQKDPIDPLVTDVVITTYNMLSVARKLLNKLEVSMLERHRERGSGDGYKGGGVPLEDILTYHGPRLSRHARTKLEFFRPFGLVLLDEVHVVPAEYFKDSLSCLRARAMVGLTATFVREDNRIADLFHIVGPKLFDMSWQELAKHRYLARVMCVEVHVGMTPEFGIEYLSKQAAILHRARSKVRRNTRAIDDAVGDDSDAPPTSSPLLVSMAASNPHKVMAVLELAAAHRDDKVLVFCDHLELLRLYSRLLRCPMVCGETSHKDRLMVFSDFQAAGVNATRGGGSGSIICISRVGDVSVNLPSASVVIQVSSHGGSRRQEGQRLGRILRPKPAVGGGESGVEGLWIKQPSQQIVDLTAVDSTTTRSVKGEEGAQAGGSGGSIESVTSAMSSAPVNDREWITALLQRAEKEGAQALFYSLVSNDTVEVAYAARRAQFLVDCGFPFHNARFPPPVSPPLAVLRQSGLPTPTNIGPIKVDPSTSSMFSGAGRFAKKSAGVKGEGMGGGISAMRPKKVPKVEAGFLSCHEVESEVRRVWAREWQVGLLGRVVSHWEDVFAASGSSQGNNSEGAPKWSVSSMLENINNSDPAVPPSLPSPKDELDVLEIPQVAMPRYGVKRERAGHQEGVNAVVAHSSGRGADPFGFDDRLVYHEF